MRFNLKFALLSLALFAIEVVIAIFHFNTFIRGFVGDVLVVILMYTFIRAFFQFPPKKIAVAVLLFSFFVEMLQYFQMADRLGITSKVVRIIIGTAFELTDLLAYSLGFLVILFSIQKEKIKG